MTRSRLLGCVMLLLLVSGSFAGARAQDAPAAPGVDRIEQLKSLDEPSTDLPPKVVAPEDLSEAGIKTRDQSYQAYYQYRIDGYQHRGRVFEWQLVSSIIIFFLVMFLVLTGVYFSWLQFRSALKSVTGEPFKETSFEASAAGFKVSSPVLGVIILAISLAFFYLYLVHIYPISEIL